MELTFMFWNLHEAARRLRAGDDKQWDQQVEIVRRHRPDVLAVTEGWDWHLDDQALFRRALVDFGYPDGALHAAKTSCDMAVMCRAGIELADAESQPPALAPWHGWLRSTLKLPGSPDPFVLMVAHLNPFDPTLRRIEGSFLRVGMQQAKLGMLVMDANSIAPGDPEPRSRLTRNFPGQPRGDRTPLRGLAAAGLVDVGASRGDRRPTYGYASDLPDADVSPVRLDQAWVTPAVDVCDYQVLESSWIDPGVDTASDHRPIMITINIGSSS